MVNFTSERYRTCDTTPMQVTSKRCRDEVTRRAGRRIYNGSQVYSQECLQGAVRWKRGTHHLSPDQAVHHPEVQVQLHDALTAAHRCEYIVEVVVHQMALAHEQKAHVVGLQRLADLLHVDWGEALPAHLNGPQHYGRSGADGSRAAESGSQNHSHSAFFYYIITKFTKQEYPFKISNCFGCDIYHVANN